MLVIFLYLGGTIEIIASIATLALGVLALGGPQQTRVISELVASIAAPVLLAAGVGGLILGFTTIGIAVALQRLRRLETLVLELQPRSSPSRARERDRRMDF